MTSADPDAMRGAPTSEPGRGAPFVLPGRFRAAVFDLDGLLVDTEPMWVAAESALLARHGHTLTPEDAAATHGRSIEDTVLAYAGRLGIADADTLRAELIGLMRAQYASRPAPRPGARELVLALRGRLPLAVASSTDGELVRLALRETGMLDAFDAIASGADLGRAKPHPAVYLAACRELGVDPRDSVAFEDSLAGVRSAKAAGLTCVGVPDRDGIDLAAAGADLVVASLAVLAVDPAER